MSLPPGRGCIQAVRPTVSSEFSSVYLWSSLLAYSVSYCSRGHLVDHTHLSWAMVRVGSPTGNLAPKLYATKVRKWTRLKLPPRLQTMDCIGVARSMRGSIGMLAMEWLMAPSTVESAAAAGLPSDKLAAYAVGRLGVLGACPVDNVVAAAFFWEPALMRRMVQDGRAVAEPERGAAVYAGICQQWGADRLAGMQGVERLGELCQKVVESAQPHGAPTFVGWRDQALPDPGPQRTFQLCQTMRELRFGRHSVAVQASAMSPLEAILSGPAGEWNAEFFGWPKPYPNVSELAEARSEIETMTDRLHAVDFESLTHDERAELRELAKLARSYATTRTQTSESTADTQESSP